MPKSLQVNDGSEITIPLRNLIAFIVFVAAMVTGYFATTERIMLLENHMEIMDVHVRQNSEFRVRWPRGELGALPDDAEQNMRLTQIEKQIQEIITEASAEVVKGKSKAELEAIYGGIVSAIKENREK